MDQRQKNEKPNGCLLPCQRLVRLIVLQRTLFLETVVLIQGINGKIMCYPCLSKPTACSYRCKCVMRLDLHLFESLAKKE